MDRQDANSLPPPLFRQPPTTLNDDMLLIDALLMANREPHRSGLVPTNDAMAAHQIRMCADALTRAVDGMGTSPAECQIDYVCDQLERVQEAASRAILALVNSRRDTMHKGYEDDDEDLPDTVTIPDPPAQADAKGGAA